MRRLIVSFGLFLWCAGAVSCAWSVYQGAMIDAEDYMAEGRYEKALHELDRAKRSGDLTTEQSARIMSLEGVCRDRMTASGQTVSSVALPVTASAEVVTP